MSDTETLDKPSHAHDNTVWILLISNCSKVPSLLITSIGFVIVILIKGF